MQKEPQAKQSKHGVRGVGLANRLHGPLIPSHSHSCSLAVLFACSIIWENTEAANSLVSSLWNWVWNICTVEPRYLELGYLNTLLSWTQTHSPCPCFSVIYYRLSRTPRYLELKPIPLALVFQSFTISCLKLPAISNRFSFPLRVWDSGVQLYITMFVFCM